MALKILADAIQQSVGSSLWAMVNRLMCSLGLGPCPEDSTVTRKIAFTVAVVALSAKMAAADGVVSQIERDAFQEIFRTSADEAKNVQRIFDLAKQDVAGFESYAQQMSDMLEFEPQLKRDVFEGLFNIAAADGVLHRAEEVYLKQVGEIFGYSDETYRSVRAQFVHDPDDAYSVLGIQSDVSDEALRSHYRRLVRENHPDVMIARGVPAEFIDMATRKLAAINAAYERIVRDRKL
ncbi:MAG: DnaJ like chaperone protein [Hyphomicrobiaceae bacterium]|jgi:DnaJ like chaperone protein